MKKEKKFLKKPVYLGGKEAMGKFIRKHLQYPKAALEHKVEGKVRVAYWVNDNGEVIKTNIERGLGYGCDEEAERLVKLFSFSKVRNRGVISTHKMNVSIHFKLPKPAPKSQVKLNYQVTPAQSKPSPSEKKENKSISYTVRW